MSFSKPLFPTSGGGGSQGPIGPTGATGLAGSTGPTGAQGDAGGNGGTPFYLNYSEYSGAPPIPLLSSTQQVADQTVLYPTGTTIEQFQTNLSGPYPKTVPGGLYNLYLYAYNNGGGQFDISFNLATTATPLIPFAESAAITVIPTTSPPFPTIITAVGSGFTLNTSEQILLSITITGATGTCSVNYQYLNGEGYSFLQSTFSSQGPTGYTGPTGQIGPSGATGPTGTFDQNTLSIFSKFGIALTDYGNTWVQNTSAPSSSWKSVSVSASGQYQTALVQGGYIYVSTNYGSTWTQDTTVTTTKNWYGVSVSASGQYQTAVVFGNYIYTSTNYGSTWTQNLIAPSLNWSGVSVSASGQYQTAVVYGGGGLIWISSDYGVTWNQTAISLGNKNWQVVSVSASGQYQTAVIYNSGFI